MKAWNIIWKILAALAAVAGIVYVIAKYGDRICAWAKKILGKLQCLCDGCDCGCDCSCTCEDDCDNCPCEDDCDDCTCCCGGGEEDILPEAEAEAAQPDAEEAAPVSAEESDFEGEA